ncbi:MAG: hypothetical protein V1495_01020 [Pseudomonadota bacterium]
MRFSAAPYRILAVAALFLVVSPLFAAGSKSSDPKPGEAGDYLEAVTRAKEMEVGDQIDLWRRFLDKHPQTSFRDEIEGNMRNLDELLTETDPIRKREQKDSDRYLRAVEFSRKIPTDDQIDLWEQYLEERPNTMYRKEIVQRLEELRAKQPKTKPQPAPGKPSAAVGPVAKPAEIPINPRLPFKDKQTAILLGTFPGLIVPGLAHWYTKDYVIAGTLTGLRVGGLAIGIPGIVGGNKVMIAAGAIIAGFSYLFDVADAPYAVDRYNEDLEQKAKSSPGMSVSFSFRF